MIKSAHFDKKAPMRVVATRKSARMTELWRVDPAQTRGITIQQDKEGRLYLCRASKDGFVQAYDLLGASGLQLKAGKQR